MIIDTIHNKKLTKEHYFKETLFGLVLYIEIEHEYTDMDKEGNIVNTTRDKEFIKATLSDAFELDLAHS